MSSILCLVDDLERMGLRSPMNSWQMESLPGFYRWPSMSQQFAQLNKELCTKNPVGKDGFQVSMEVNHFKPSELHVKVVDNNIIVEAKHEERAADDHGYISRHFVRRYTIPKGYDPQKVVSTLSSDGVLTVSVPKPAIEDQSAKERVIQIQQTGPAHLNVKKNTKEEEEKSKK